jgi:hypothetical protein
MKQIHMRLYLFLLLVSVSVLSMAQMQVTGVVVDDKGESLPGVNVQILGQNKGYFISIIDTLGMKRCILT